MATSYIKNTPNKENLIPSISWNQLRRAGRSLQVPFELSLADSKFPLSCDVIVRLIPGKRLVVYGTWENASVVAKIFVERGKAKKNLERDAEGVEALINSNIPTPKLLYKGTAQDPHIHLLIFERIFDAKTLDVIWQEKRSLDEMLPLLKYITIELATQHVLGIVQRDLHLKNFLISAKQIYTLDGGCVEQDEEVLSREESLIHLSLFFSQLGVGTEELQAELFDVYAKARGWLIKSTDSEMLQKHIKKWNIKRWQRYKIKIFRNCTAFERLVSSRSTIVYDRDYYSAEFLNFLNNPEMLISQYPTKVLKAGRSATVFLVKVEDRMLVVKRYNMKNAWHWLRRCLRETRAASAWRMAQKLRLHGVPTPKPVAFIQQEFFGLRGRSYFVMEYVAAPHVGEYFSKHRNEEERTLKIAERVVFLIKTLADLHLTHGDLKMTNILISNDNPVLIDLDGMIEHKTFIGLKSAFQKELNRFMQNWHDFPSVRNIFSRLIK